tara:strand:- start:138 stop:557 length:420 start_codon:yes stop_codon:yes gene_type:complete
MSKFDEIDEFLDVEPVDAPKNNKIEKVEKKEDSALDYEYSRGNLYSLIEKGQEALNGILEVAQGSDHPRAYEVAGQIIKSVGDTTDKLIDLQAKMKNLKKEDKDSPKTVNNALFVGSTSDLSKLLKKGVLNNNVENEEE